MIPGQGYVGVGIVKEKAVPAKEFKVEYNGEMVSIIDAPTKTNGLDYEINDLNNCYYL
ncbi:hypothetical protein [Halanaerobium hydrogeniformans]|uniref:hypothetical protein n=1 Tax=Halanaerobium hydrogeniformans TaxID=656519 RepID=UPI0003124531|nr:hypothetical protein [Halanaerobium hydrogeniformans]